MAALLLLAAAATATSVDTSSAAFTSASTNPGGSIVAAEDWTPPMVTVSVPPIIRGTVSITATASDGETGIDRVVLSWAVDGTSTWTPICTRTAAPYTCSLDTLAIADGTIDVRAVATDRAGYSTTDIEEGILVDNTAPTATLDPVGSPLAGSVTLSATVADGGAGIASVLYQYATANGSNWATACTATASPWTCRFDTTVAPDGAYDFRAIATDNAGNARTTATTKNRQIDNRAPSVSVDPVDPFLRGTRTVSATAFSSAGVASVRIEHQRSGTSTWTSLCTDTTSPYSCTWNTASVADGNYTVRAVMVDAATKTTTSATVTTQVDNSATRGWDVQAVNGGTLGRITTGDAITVTYTRAVRLTSILAGWTGAPQAVSVRIRDGALLAAGTTDDTVDVLTTGTLPTAVNLGTVNLRGNYVKSARTVTYAATMTHQSVTVNGTAATAITLNLGTTANANNLNTISTTPTMLWAPSSIAVDVDGIPVSTAPVTEQGPADRDL